MKYRIVKLSEQRYKLQRQFLLAWFDVEEVVDPREPSQPVLFSSAEEAEQYARQGNTLGSVVKEFTV